VEAQKLGAMMSSVPVPETMFALADQHLVPQQPAAAEQEQLCYVHCKCCDTILAVRIGSMYRLFPAGLSSRRACGKTK